MLFGIAASGVRALLGAARLASDDPPVLGDAFLAIVRSILVVAPTIVAFARSSRVRLVWAPLALVPLLLRATGTS
jgi:hypothetical protein